jgi:hypothetical protein
LDITEQGIKSVSKEIEKSLADALDEEQATVPNLGKVKEAIDGMEEEK